MTPGNKHTYISFTDNDVFSSEWGGWQTFSSQREALQEISEKHCPSISEILKFPVKD